MRKNVEIIGQRFGRQVALALSTERTNDGRAKYACKCDCGQTCVVSGKELKKAKGTKSCGCQHREVGKRSAKDMAGMRFGGFTVLERAGTSKLRTAMWLCQCDCGNKRVISGSYLRQGYTKSCGCLKGKLISQRLMVDISGRKFGKLTVIKQHTSMAKPRGGVTWLCQCDCGNEHVVPGQDLLSGNTKSCGCAKSHGERLVAKTLRVHAIRYCRQKSFDGCRGVKPQKFDFYLPDFNAVVEFQGIQHYEPVDAFGGEEAFVIRQRNDRIKKDFCKANNIDMVEIRHDEIEDIEAILHANGQLGNAYGNKAPKPSRPEGSMPE